MDPSPYTPSTFQNIILTILAVLVIMVCIGCIYAFFRAIFLFIFSQGKDDKIKSAWSSIRYMIWGIILTISLLFIFPVLFKWIGISNYEEYSASNIFNKAGSLLGNVSEVKNVVKKSQELNQIKGDLYYEDDKIENLVDDGYRL